MSTPTVLALIAIYLLIGGLIAAAFWRRAPRHLSEVQLRNGRTLLPVIVTCWPSVVIVGVLCQFQTGRQIVAWLFDVEAADIWPGRGERA